MRDPTTGELGLADGVVSTTAEAGRQLAMATAGQPDALWDGFGRDAAAVLVDRTGCRVWP